MATREIVVIDISTSSDGLSLDLQAVFWLVAAATHIRPLPTFVSQVPLASAVSWGITPAELAALQAGTLIERTYDTGQMPKAGLTVGSVEANLQAAYAAAQTALTNAAPASKFIGSFWDGTTWTLAP